MNEITAVSIFSGCGGLDLGFIKAGIKILLTTDNWDIAIESAKANHDEGTFLIDDIKNIDFTKVIDNNKSVNILMGGPPCPPYSQTRHYLTHKKNGINDDDLGFTLFEYFRAVKELQPKIFLFENVDGFTHKTNIDSLKYFEKKSEELGYQLSYKNINSANYGVPQTRKRFFCVGSKSNLSNFKFPIETHADQSKKNSNLFLKPWVTCGEIFNDINIGDLDEKEYQVGGKHKDLLKQIPPGQNYLFFTEKRGYKDPIFEWKSRYWTFLLKLSPDRPSWTIQANHSTNQGPFHWDNRFLQIKEIKRIQTFPDDYIILGNFKDQWKQIGNAVPPQLSSILASAIINQYF